MCDLARVEALRQQLPQRIAWPILFIKAFALAAANYPRLRQTWCSWPWRHLFQHDQNVGMLATHREFRGEPWLFWSRFSSPESRSLPLLQRELDRYLTEPVEKIFKRQLLFSAVPVLLRRLIWWWNLNLAGAKRARRIGTFFLTTLAGRGAEIQHPPAFLTANLTYGPLDERGMCRVTIAYDHRLMDGRMVADILGDLDAALNGPIAAELEQLIADAAVSCDSGSNVAANTQSHAA